ncbi:hypothetical protein [Priestia megaterium]|uniref:hypothetical protein n=1 Tax=Priestia megaterium TaxID=1404 RepID=UPI002E248508|nr:hypothetical protein [Priestia megaterium]
MATIIYLEINGVCEVENKIIGIALEGKEGDSDSQTLAKFIRQGLDQLESVGVPDNKKLLGTFEEDNGHPRTFNLLNEITSRPPLLQFRVNRSVPGAFRAIFFEYEYQGEQLLVFTKALLKTGDPNPPELQQAIEDSYKIYLDFLKSPEKYLEGNEFNEQEKS